MSKDVEQKLGEPSTQGQAFDSAIDELKATIREQELALRLLNEVGHSVYNKFKAQEALLAQIARIVTEELEAFYLNRSDIMQFSAGPGSPDQRIAVVNPADPSVWGPAIVNALHDSAKIMAIALLLAAGSPAEARKLAASLETSDQPQK